MSSKENGYSESTYQVLEGAINKGENYEIIFIANVVLELVLDDNIKNFLISSNDKKFLPFDDVVIETENNKGIKEHFAIQLKHGDKSLTTQHLKGKTGEFSIKKYFERVKNLQHLNNFKLILLTNRKYNTVDTCFKLEDEEFNLKMIPYESEKLFRGGVSYKFEVDETANDDFRKFFKNFVLYCNHLNVERMERKLSDQFTQRLDCEKRVFVEYLNFITEWSKIKGTRKKLNKAWMEEIIAIRLLSPLIQLFSCNTEDNEKADIFRRFINSFNITIFEERDSKKITELWSLKKEFEQVDVQTVNKLKNKYQILEKNTKNVDDLNKIESSMVLWLLDKCPLIVKYEKCTARAIRFFKDKRFIILHEDLSNEDFEHVFFGFQMFRNLSDLLKEDTSLYEQLVKTFYCSLQGKEKISLETLIGEDKLFKEQITTNDLLLFLKDDFMIDKKEILPDDIYIERYFSRHVIDYNFLSEVDKNSVIIISNFNTFNKYLKQFQMVDIETLLKQNLKKEEFENRKVFYFCRNDCSQEKFEAVCSKLSGKDKYHLFKIFDEKLEWIYSRGGISDLKQFQIEEELIEEKELYSNAKNVVIICGDPGLGKTTSIKHLKNHTYPSFWTLLIYPKDHSKYFHKKQHNFNQFEKYILEEVIQKDQIFSFKVFQFLFKSRRVNFIWDGLDEISETSLNEVINIIKSLSEMGFKQCITSRNNLRNKLESSFFTIATTIREFSENEQKYYITKRLQCSEEILKSAFTRIQNSISFFKYNDILSVPLQIYMFTELFIQDWDKYSALLTNTFSLTDLYYHFIFQKFKIFFKVKGNLPDSNSIVNHIENGYRKYRILSYQQVALQMYFSEEDVYFIDSDTCERFLTEIREDKDNVGIITGISSDNLPNFIHNTYGEYFAALYLSENYKNIPDLSQFIFKEKYKNIRFLFDLILAKNCPAHIAVLYKNFEALKKCEKNVLTSEDLGGRNPLQLACSWGENFESYPLLQATQKDVSYGIFRKRYIVYEKIEHRVKKPNLEHQKILRYLLDICNVENTDRVYYLNTYFYADEAFSLSNLAVLSEKHKIPFRKLKNFRNIPLILYYSAVFDCSVIFSRFKTIPQVYTEEGDSLLSVAASNGSLASCERLLINHKLKVNASNKYNETPLYQACNNGHVEIVKLLLSNGAKVNTIAGIHVGYTPLHIVSESGNIEIVKLLVNNGAQVNTGIEIGDTPLRRASENGHVEVVKLLIENGAEINARMEFDNFILHIVSENGHFEIVKLIVNSGGLVNVPNKWGYTPLHLASKYGHFEIVKFLVNNRGLVNAVSKRGDTPLYLASKNEHVDIAELLIQKGAKAGMNRSLNFSSNGVQMRTRQDY